MEIADTFNELGHHKTVDGVIIEWPFLVEALENAGEIDADLIQEALELVLNNEDLNMLDNTRLTRLYAVLGVEIIRQVDRYIGKIKEIKDED